MTKKTILNLYWQGLSPAKIAKSAWANERLKPKEDRSTMIEVKELVERIIIEDVKRVFAEEAGRDG